MLHEVWIVPPHADKTLPAVLCPEQADCVHIAKGAIRALELLGLDEKKAVAA